MRFHECLPLPCLGLGHQCPKLLKETGRRAEWRSLAVFARVEKTVVERSITMTRATAGLLGQDDGVRGLRHRGYDLWPCACAGVPRKVDGSGSGWKQARLNRLPPWHPLAAGDYRALTLRRTEIQVSSDAHRSCLDLGSA